MTFYEDAVSRLRWIRDFIAETDAELATATGDAWFNLTRLRLYQINERNKAWLFIKQGR